MFKNVHVQSEGRKGKKMNNDDERKSYEQPRYRQRKGDRYMIQKVFGGHLRQLRLGSEKFKNTKEEVKRKEGKYPFYAVLFLF